MKLKLLGSAQNAATTEQLSLLMIVQFLFIGSSLIEMTVSYPVCN